MTLKNIIESICPISDNALESISEKAELVRIKKGVTIIKQGEKARDFVFIKSGIFRIYFNCDGKEKTVAFGCSGDPYTSIHTYHSNLPSVFSFEAMVDSEIWQLDIKEFEKLATENQEICRWFSELLLEQLQAFERRSVLFGTYNATRRYEIFVYNRPEIYRYVPSKYIAQYLDIAPETLCRIQAAFARK